MLNFSLLADTESLAWASRKELETNSPKSAPLKNLHVPNFIQNKKRNQPNDAKVSFVLDMVS